MLQQVFCVLDYMWQRLTTEKIFKCLNVKSIFKNLKTKNQVMFCLSDKFNWNLGDG